MNSIWREFCNSKGERVLIDLVKTENGYSDSSLLHVWYKKGYTETELPSCWSMKVYVYTKDGNCIGKYNPTIIPGQCKINFEWVLEATMENAQKLIAECQRLAEEKE